MENSSSYCLRYFLLADSKESECGKNIELEANFTVLAILIDTDARPKWFAGSIEN